MNIENKIVMPGDVIHEAMELENQNKKVILGPGLKKSGSDTVACRCGILRRKANVFFVDCYQKRYIPVRNDPVVGVVTSKSGDIFRVDIGGSELAALSYLSFEGASKKNRPDVNVGDVIYAKVLIANRDLEPELICVDSYGRKETLGVITDGFIFNCSINLVRKILNPKCQLLVKLKDEMPYELAIGMNGKIWIRGRNIQETIGVGNAILAAEFLSEKDINKMCSNITILLAQ